METVLNAFKQRGYSSCIYSEVGERKEGYINIYKRLNLANETIFSDKYRWMYIINIETNKFNCAHGTCIGNAPLNICARMGAPNYLCLMHKWGVSHCSAYGRHFTLMAVFHDIAWGKDWMLTVVWEGLGHYMVQAFYI